MAGTDMCRPGTHTFPVNIKLQSHKPAPPSLCCCSQLFPNCRYRIHINCGIFNARMNCIELPKGKVGCVGNWHLIPGPSNADVFPTIILVNECKWREMSAHIRKERRILVTLPLKRNLGSQDAFYV
jgi:hypothetical protein